MPVIVTEVPPAVVPELGLTPVTVLVTVFALAGDWVASWTTPAEDTSSANIAVHLAARYRAVQVSPDAPTAVPLRLT